MNLSSLSPRRLLARWRENTRGISAVEFALIAPVLVIFYFGCIEISTMLMADRRVTSVAATVGDLVAREPSMDTAEMTNIMNAGLIGMSGIVLRGRDNRADAVNRTRIRVSSIVWNAGGTQTEIAWSRSTANWSAHAAGTPMTVPTGLVPTNGSVVFAEVEYNYASITGLFDPETGFLFDVSQTLSDEYYARPRRSNVIPFN